MRRIVSAATAVAMGLSLGFGKSAIASSAGHESAMRGIAKRSGRPELAELFEPKGSEKSIAERCPVVVEDPMNYPGAPRQHRNGHNRHRLTCAERRWYDAHGGFYADAPEWNRPVGRYAPDTRLMGDHLLAQIVAEQIGVSKRQPRRQQAKIVCRGPVGFERLTVREQKRALARHHRSTVGRGKRVKRFA